MPSFALIVAVVAVVAVVLAWAARGRLRVLSEELSSTRRELLSSRSEEGDLAGELKTLQRHVELLAKGVALDPLMVREKRLYANANTLKLAQLLESGSSVAVIDVRSAGEWGGGHIEGALHIPVDELERRLSEVPRDGTPLYLICASGGRSAAAADLLGQRGYLHVHNVEGGMQAWRGAAVQG